MKRIPLLFILSVLGVCDLPAVTTLSNGHVDIWEVHYDASTRPAEFALHVHDDETGFHYEPADVILQVNESSYFSSPATLSGVLGSSAYILPASQEADMLYGGVSAVGSTGVFQNNRISLRMVSAGSNNPGNFVLYRFGGSGNLQIGLQATGANVDIQQFTVPVGGHEHWNWGFSNPGIYTFEIKAVGVLVADLSVLETPVELYTFQVIPEPSTCVLLVVGLMGLVRYQKRERHSS